MDLCQQSDVSTFKYAVSVCHSFPSKGLNFMAAVTVCSDFGAQENKICHCFPFLPICHFYFNKFRFTEGLPLQTHLFNLTKNGTTKKPSVGNWSVSICSQFSKHFLGSYSVLICKLRSKRLKLETSSIAQGIRTDCSLVRW